MRRHFLFAEDEKERSVGDGKANLLRLWHARRLALLHGDASHAAVALELTWLWDLAKPAAARSLSRRHYVAFFARCAKALVQPLASDAVALAVAQRDWSYDLEGAGRDGGGHGDAAPHASDLEHEHLAAEPFRDALLQLAELVLPVESAGSVFASFFHALRVAVAEPEAATDAQDARDARDARDEQRVGPWRLKALQRVAKISAAFLQHTAPSSDALRSIRGLSPPDARVMSLKQLLLAYNPRKLALARAFSSQVRAAAADGRVAPAAPAVDGDVDADADADVEQRAAQRLHAELVAAIGAGGAPRRGQQLHRESEWHWDPERARLAALAAFPALRVAVVGPPGGGKTRLAKLVARRLHLQYLSLASVVQAAVERVLLLRRRAASSEEGESESESKSESESEVEVEASEPDMEATLLDADVDALLRGGVLPRAKAVAVLQLVAARAVRAGVGVLLDDVLPCELASHGDATLDYVVALTALPGDLEPLLAAWEVAPTSRRVYSARELAALRATGPAAGETLADSGFADAVAPRRTLADVPGGASETLADAPMEPPVVVDDAEVDDGGHDDDDDAGARAGEGGESDQQAERPAAPRELSPAERQEVEPPGEPTLPHGSVAVLGFSRRFREYVARMRRELESASASGSGSAATYALVVLQACQPLSWLRDQCLQAIAGDASGLSRFSASHQATRVALPDELSAASRAERLRWLLYGDWSELLQAEDAAAASTALSASFSRLPRRDPERRLLSRWRDFCPVASSRARELVLGDPACAAVFSGRVYLLASTAARRAFCAEPLAFLSLEPPVAKHRRLWLVAPAAVGASGLVHSYAVALEHGLEVPAVRAGEALMAAAPMALQMRLMGGQTVSAVQVAAVVAETLLKQQQADGWLLLDLPLTSEVASVLVEQGCVPDAIVLLDAEAATELQGEEDGDDRVASTAMTALRREQFQAEKADAEAVAAALGAATRVLSCPLFQQPSDTLAALERALNPLAPRVDRFEEGHVPELVASYDPATVFTADLSDDEQDATPVSEDLDAEQDAEAEDDEEDDDKDDGDPEALAAAKAARRRARSLQGESGRFCPVAWRSRGTLVPGLSSSVLALRQQLYAFAGERERRAFERDPGAYLPWGPRATAKLVPCVLLLGVRGSGRDRLAQALAKASTAVSAASDAVAWLEVDMAAVHAAAERLQLLDELQREDERAQPEELFAAALQTELARITAVWRDEHQLQLRRASWAAKVSATATGATSETVKHGAALVVAGLGPEPSGIPSPAALEACFRRELFPLVVLPLHVSERRAVETMLAEWEAARPAPHRKLALVRKKPRRVDGDGDAADAEQPGEEEGEDEEDEPSEDVEAARQEQRERLREQFAEDQAALAEALDTLRARGVSVCAPVATGSVVRQTLRRARRALGGFLARREALFEHCDALEAGDESLRLQLASGELHVGKHGAACPVTGRTDPVAFELAVVHREQLYFPRSREARRAFAACPALFLDRDSLPPRHPPTCCVAGGPKAGKTQVARALAEELGAVYVSPQAAVDWVLQCQGGSTLRRRLLALGGGLEDALDDAQATYDAISARLRSSECQTRGWVLDGYLLTRQQLHLSLPSLSLSASTSTRTPSSLQPDMLFVVERGFQHAWCELRKHLESAEAPADEATARSELRDAFALWQQHRLELLGSWTRVFGDFHVLQLDSERHSLWHVVAQARARLVEQQQLAAAHASAQASGRAARVLGVVRTHAELLARQHRDFQTFCPVELRAGRFSTSRASNRERCVDVGGSSFWLRNERDVAHFLASPESFLGYDDASSGLGSGPPCGDELAARADVEEEARALVSRAPVSASLLSLLTVSDCDFPELKGYCPVTFAHGGGAKDWAALRPGSVFFRASYRSKAFVFVSEAARRAFCAEPTRFAALTLPVKLPPQVPLAKSYPGQLEQQLGAALNDALLALGSERPKFPHVSSRASAVVFLALSLRAVKWRYRSFLSSASTRDARDEEDEPPDEDQQRRQLRRDQRAEAEAVAKRDAFARDCQLGEQLKAALIPARAPCGSGAKGARGVRETHESHEELLDEDKRPATGDDVMQSGQESEDNVELLRRRFDVIVAGDHADQKPLSTDVSLARTHAQAAFLEYTASPRASAAGDTT